MSSPNGLFIYLLGFAGTGKLTIAKALRQQFDCLLVDNHFINNVVFGLIDPDGKTPLSPAVWERVREVRAAVFATIRDLSKPGRHFIFTNELLQGRESHERVFEEVRELARARGARLLVVRLQVEPEELARRVVSPGRAEAFKDIDAQAARRKAGEHVLFKPRSGECLDLEVTGLSAQAAATCILRHAGVAPHTTL